MAKETIGEALKKEIKPREIGEKELKKKSAKETLDMVSKCVAPATFIITIMTSLVSGLIYAFRCGMLSYWGISFSYIPKQGENPLLVLLIKIALTLMLGIANIIVYKMLTSQEKIIIKILKFVGAVALFDAILYALMFINACWTLPINADIVDIVRKPGFMKFLGETFWTIWYVGIIFFSPALIPVLIIKIRTLFNNLKKKRAKQKEENKTDIIKSDSDGTEKEKRTVRVDKLSNILEIIRVAVICYALLVMVIYAYGFYWAHMDTSFRVINNTQVILYEGEDLFVVSECEIITDKNGENVIYIDQKSKTEIPKSGITTTEIRVKKAYRNKKQ